MMVTRRQIVEARHPRCGWSEDALAAAIEKRFPGGGDVDLVDLVDAWIADRSLSRKTLSDCSYLTCTLADKPKAGLYLNPMRKLVRLAAELRSDGN